MSSEKIKGSKLSTQEIVHMLKASVDSQFAHSPNIKQFCLESIAAERLIYLEEKLVVLKVLPLKG
jgi:hypothetical protein